MILQLKREIMGNKVRIYTYKYRHIYTDRTSGLVNDNR